MKEGTICNGYMTGAGLQEEKETEMYVGSVWNMVMKVKEMGRRNQI